MQSIRGHSIVLEGLRHAGMRVGYACLPTASSTASRRVWSGRSSASAGQQRRPCCMTGSRRWWIEWSRKQPRAPPLVRAFDALPLLQCPRPLGTHVFPLRRDAEALAHNLVCVTAFQLRRLRLRSHWSLSAAIRWTWADLDWPWTTSGPSGRTDPEKEKHMSGATNLRSHPTDEPRTLVALAASSRSVTAGQGLEFSWLRSWERATMVPVPVDAQRPFGTHVDAQAISFASASVDEVDSAVCSASVVIDCSFAHVEGHRDDLDQAKPEVRPMTCARLFSERPGTADEYS